MSRTTARLVFALTCAFFAVFFLWPILQIVKGGFTDENGRPTSPSSGPSSATRPTSARSLIRSFSRAPGRRWRS